MFERVKTFLNYVRRIASDTAVTMRTFWCVSSFKIFSATQYSSWLLIQCQYLILMCAISAISINVDVLSTLIKNHLRRHLLCCRHTFSLSLMSDESETKPNQNQNTFIFKHTFIYYAKTFIVRFIVVVTTCPDVNWAAWQGAGGHSPAGAHLQLPGLLISEDC